MTDARAQSVWVEGVQETLFGRRGLVKAAHACLPLGVAASLNPSLELARLGAACLMVLLVAGCWAQAAILANDLADSAEDAAAGKRRWVREVPRAAGWAVVAFVVAVGAFVLLAAGRRGALVAYGAAGLRGGLRARLWSACVRVARGKSGRDGGARAGRAAGQVGEPALPPGHRLRRRSRKRGRHVRRGRRARARAAVAEGDVATDVGLAGGHGGVRGRVAADVAGCHGGLATRIGRASAPRPRPRCCGSCRPPTWR